MAKTKPEPAAANFSPAGNRILIEPSQARDVTEGGILLPDTAKKKPSRGTVIATGEGKMLDSGIIVPPPCKPGDVILYGKYAGSDVEIGMKEFIVLDGDEVLGVFTK